MWADLVPPFNVMFRASVHGYAQTNFEDSALKIKIWPFWPLLAREAKTGVPNQKIPTDMKSGLQNLCNPKVWRSELEKWKFSKILAIFEKFLKKFGALNQNSDSIVFLAMVQRTHSENLKVLAQKLSSIWYNSSFWCFNFKLEFFYSKFDFF